MSETVKRVQTTMATVLNATPEAGDEETDTEQTEHGTEFLPESE